jgi:hypothetical protein
MIKRISRRSGFFTGKEKVVTAIYWPMRPEKPVTRTAKISQDRLPQSLHSEPHREKSPKGEVQ